MVHTLDHDMKIYKSPYEIFILQWSFFSTGVLVILII